MSKHTRRNFLKKSAIASGTMALAPLASSEAQTNKPMVISRWKGESKDIKTIAEKLTRQSIEALGGMKKFVKKGDVVWLKPNIGWNKKPEQAANTNPDLVATLIRMCFDAGAKKVQVGDFACNDARQTYPNSGIAAAAKANGAEMVYVNPDRFRKVDLKGRRLKKWGVCAEILDADVFINAAIVKDHCDTKLTMCMKNLMGIVEKRDRFHQDLPTTIADINAFARPNLNVLDAIRVLTAHGPMGGRLEDVKQMNIVAAGTDIVALDAFGCEIMGHKPTSIGTVVAGHERGLGEIDYKKVSKEITVT